MPGCLSGLAKINWPCTCSTNAIVLGYSYEVSICNKYVFVELFDTCMYAHCSVNSSKTFMLKVCLLSAPCCCDIVTIVLLHQN